MKQVLITFPTIDIDVNHIISMCWMDNDKISDVYAVSLYVLNGLK